MQEKTKPKSSSVRSNKSRTEATRAALTTAARELFAENGYAATSTPEIVKAAGVTRGALYHHFEDKLAIFRAVLTAEFVAVANAIEARASNAPESAIAALMEGSRGYLSAMQDPGRVRIMLVEGPAVLGQHEVDEIDRASSADSLRDGLAAAIQAKQLKTLPLDALTTQLSAVFDRAALAISRGDSQQDHLAVIDALLTNLTVD